MQWEKLKDAQDGDSITLKGFLYQTHDGRWILSQDPHLKSCCIGCAEKHFSQVFLNEDYSGFNRSKPLTVQGSLHKNFSESYSLEDATALQSEQFPVWTAGILLLGLGFCVFKLKRLLLP